MSDIHPMLAVTSVTFFFCGRCEVWFIWSKQKSNIANATCGPSPVQQMFRDWTEAMLDRRGPGPGPVLTLYIQTACLRPALLCAGSPKLHLKPAIHISLLRSLQMFCGCLLLCHLVIFAVMFVWQCCYHFFSMCVQARSVFFFHIWILTQSAFIYYLTLHSATFCCKLQYTMADLL